MPNWCYNEIKVSGKKENIKKLGIDILNSEGMLFQSLIGDRYNDDKIDNWGTRDVKIDHFVEEFGSNLIKFRGETAWNPPVEFCKKLAAKYDVDVEMYFEEPGLNFAGEALLYADGSRCISNYDYATGVYFLRGFEIWLEAVFSMYDEEDLDHLNMSYLAKEEKEICNNLIKQS